MKHMKFPRNQEFLWEYLRHPGRCPRPARPSPPGSSRPRQSSHGTRRSLGLPEQDTGLTPKNNSFRSMKMEFRRSKTRAQILSTTPSFWSLQVPHTKKPCLQLHTKKTWHIFLFFFPFSTQCKVNTKKILMQKFNS